MQQHKYFGRILYCFLNFNLAFMIPAILYDPSGRILIGQRHEKDTSALKWEFPGGKIKPAETYEEALIREIKEELGLEISSEYLRKHTSISPISNVIKSLTFFKYSKPIVDNIQCFVHTQLKWVKPIDLIEYDFLSANIPVVKKLSLVRK